MSARVVFDEHWAAEKLLVLSWCMKTICSSCFLYKIIMGSSCFLKHLKAQTQAKWTLRSRRSFWVRLPASLSEGLLKRAGGCRDRREHDFLAGRTVECACALFKHKHILLFKHIVQAHCSSTFVWTCTKISCSFNRQTQMDMYKN